MNTPAHMMLNLGLLGRQKPPLQQLAVLAGAVLPDVPIFVFYFWEKIWRALPEVVIWEQYFDARWQMVFDLFHSFPVAILGGALSLWLKWKGFALFWPVWFCIAWVTFSCIMMMHIDISFLCQIGNSSVPCRIGILTIMESSWQSWKF